jgi:hypothetical protein
LLPFFFLPLLAFANGASSLVGELFPRFLKKPSLLRELLLNDELPSDKLLTDRPLIGLLAYLIAGLVFVYVVNKVLVWPGYFA